MSQQLPDSLTRTPLPGLGDTFAARVARNFFTHSGHVPLTLLILELLLAPSVGGYFIEPDPYLLLLAGIGLHHGPVVESVLGGRTVKAYDFIGDTVNTAQRLCSAALAGELLVSVKTALAISVPLSGQREIAAKGNSEPLAACVLARSA